MTLQTMIELTLWRVRIGNFGCKPSTAVRELKRTKLHGIQSVSHWSVLQEMLLVQSGDVELNPGPETEGLYLLSNLDSSVNNFFSLLKQQLFLTGR